MGLAIQNISNNKFSIRIREASTVHVYPGLENGWIGYEQLAGSWYASTKRAEIEALTCVAVWMGSGC